MANFQHQHGIVCHVVGCLGQQWADEIHAVGATGGVATQGHFGFCTEFRRQGDHAVGVHIGRVAQNQVKLAGQGRLCGRLSGVIGTKGGQSV